MPVPARRLAGLDRRVAGVIWWAAGSGHRVTGVGCGAGSGVNGRRPERRRVLSGPPVTVIVVGHRDRLARFGVGQLESALESAGGRVVVAGSGEGAGDLVRDMIEVLTSGCAGLDGRGGAGNRAVAGGHRGRAGGGVAAA